MHSRLRKEQLRDIVKSKGEDCAYKPGDLCLDDSRARKKGLSPKLEPQWVGPFEVANAYPNRTYRLKGYRNVVNESRLKLYHTIGRLVSSQADRGSTNIDSKSNKLRLPLVIERSCGDAGPRAGKAGASSGQTDNELSSVPVRAKGEETPSDTRAGHKQLGVTSSSPPRRSTRERKTPVRLGYGLAN